MSRIIIGVLLFLLPTLVYAAYVFLRRRGTAAQAAVFDEAPLVWLLVAGAVLVVMTVLVFGNSSGGRPGQPYDPTVGRTQPSEPDRIK